MFSINTWHGSLVNGIKEFKPTSHFGSRIQACCAIVAHAALDKNSGVPTIYDCNLVCKESEILELNDWGDPKPQAVLFRYCEKIGRGDYFRNVYFKEGRRRNLEASSDKWIEWLICEAKSSGHKLLSYENEVEGEGLSYCVIDNSIVSISKSTEVSFSELKNALQVFDRQYFGFFNHDWNKIQKFLAEKSC